jgi:hypothetical protein
MLKKFSQLYFLKLFSGEELGGLRFQIILSGFYNFASKNSWMLER